MSNLNALLEQLRNCTDVSGFTHGELERRAGEFACEGCGLGKLCKKGTDDCDNNDHCHECDACVASNYNDCTDKYCWRPQCDNCFWCGCPKCELDDADYDGYDETPRDMYFERYYANMTKITNALKQSSVLDAWMPLLGKNTIEMHFPWETYSNYWRTYLFDKDNLLSCSLDMYNSLSEEDKMYFKNPIYEYALNYNVLRIMAGLGGLVYKT